MEVIDPIIIQSLRDQDTDRYIAAFFAPSDKRAALFTLYAFNQELEKIPFTVSEPMLGEIRLQWWRDALDPSAHDKELSGNPIADNLRMLIGKYSFPKNKLQELIDARSFELSGEVMPDMNSLMVYFKKVYGALFYLSACILSDDISDDTEVISREAGYLYGLTQCQVKLPFHSSKGVCYLPETLLGEFSVDLDSIFKGENLSELNELLVSIRIETEKRNKEIKLMIKSLGREQLPVFLPILLIDVYLKQLSQKKHNHLRDIIQINPMYRLWMYWKFMAFGKA